MLASLRFNDGRERVASLLAWLVVSLEDYSERPGLIVGMDGGSPGVRLKRVSLEIDLEPSAGLKCGIIVGE